MIPFASKDGITLCWWKASKFDFICIGFLNF